MTVLAKTGQGGVTETTPRESPGLPCPAPPRLSPTPLSCTKVPDLSRLSWKADLFLKKAQEEKSTEEDMKSQTVETVPTQTVWVLL